MLPCFLPRCHPFLALSYLDLLRRRSAAEYAAFLLPHLGDGVVLLDCGCGPASITYGLAER